MIMQGLLDLDGRNSQKYLHQILLKKQQQNEMPTFVPVSEEILDDRNGCNTQKNPLEINIMFKLQTEASTK